mgnify:CR=1 FL=1
MHYQNICIYLYPTNTDKMENLIKKAKELLEATKDLHPQMNMANPKEERLYLAYHSLSFDIAEREVVQKTSKRKQN